MLDTLASAAPASYTDTESNAESEQIHLDATQSTPASESLETSSSQPLASAGCTSIAQEPGTHADSASLKHPSPEAETVPTSSPSSPLPVPDAFSTDSHNAPSSTSPSRADAGDNTCSPAGAADPSAAGGSEPVVAVAKPEQPGANSSKESTSSSPRASSSRLRQLAPTQLQQAVRKSQQVRIAGLVRVYQRRDRAGRTWQHLVALTTEAEPASFAAVCAGSVYPDSTSASASPAAEWLSVDELRARSAAGDLLGIEPLDLVILLEQTLAYSSAFIGVLTAKYEYLSVLVNDTADMARPLHSY